jgi:hypothetical protein
MLRPGISARVRGQTEMMEVVARITRRVGASLARPCLTRLPRPMPGVLCHSMAWHVDLPSLLPRMHPLPVPHRSCPLGNAAVEPPSALPGQARTPGVLEGGVACAEGPHRRHQRSVPLALQRTCLDEQSSPPPKFLRTQTRGTRLLSCPLSFAGQAARSIQGCRADLPTVAIRYRLHKAPTAAALVRLRPAARRHRHLSSCAGTGGRDPRLHVQQGPYPRAAPDDRDDCDPAVARGRDG